MEQTSRNEQSTENTTVVKEFTEDLQEVLNAVNDGAGGVGVIVSPFFLIGRRNHFAAFAVNSTGDKVHYILADGNRLDKHGIPAVVLHGDNAEEFKEAVLKFKKILDDVETKWAKKEEVENENKFA